MFERRIKALLVVLLIALLGVGGRLVDLQIIHAEDYREQAAAALLLTPQTLPFVRGRVLDRTGLLLGSDEPSWDVRIDYGVLAEDPHYLAARAARFGRSGRYGQGLDGAAVERALRGDIEAIWRKLAYFSGDTVESLRQRASEICRRVQRIRRAVARRRGFDAPVAEERMAHSVVTGLDDQQQIAARREFGAYPWLKIEAATHRRYHRAECLAHILGRVGPVDARQMKNDPNAGDALRCYRGNETVGVTGVEFAAEELLRGSRGRFRKNRKGQVLQDVKPQAGRDVHLTIRYDLQQQLYDLLASALAELPCSPGGSIVVLDVASREVLALVSYPGYDANRFRETEYYDRLRRDAVAMPLRFRAVSNRYAPGSLVKPLICLAGLSGGAINLETQIECTGYLFPENPTAGASKCWQVAGTSLRKAHGAVTVTEAIEGSCNIFMYQVGVAMGVGSLCNFFDMVGFGRPSGTGLREETWGINPTPSWLNDVKGRPVVPADARLFAIGQGEASVTPIQAANLMATYASGIYRKVSIMREGGDNAEWQLPVTPAHLAAVQQGLYAVVNSPLGTAYKTARLVHDRYALCGKTGSATAQPRPITYKVSYADPNGQAAFTILPAGSRREAIDSFVLKHPQATFEAADVVVHSRYPAEPPSRGDRHSHAWFAGYLQGLDSAGRPRYEDKQPIALAVLVEYGGSGGHTSGPIARQAARMVIETLGDDLDPDATVVSPEPAP